MASDNQIIAEIIVEGVDKFKADLKGAQGSVESLNSAIEKTGTESKEATSEATKSFESFRTQLKGMTSELTAMNLQLAEMKDAGKAGTKEFTDLEKKMSDLQKKAGNLKDAMGDAAEQIKAAGSDTSGLDKAIRAVGTATAAFQVFEGAAVLAGKGNEDLQKALVKLNAVMAITQGLQQIQNELVRQDSIFKKMASAATAAYNVVVGQSTGALKLFRIALAATGIGLAIVGIFALVENWYRLKAAVFGSTESLESFNKKLETTNKLREEQQKQDELDILRRKQKGQNDLQIAQAELEMAKKRKEASDAELVRLEKAYKEEKDLAFEKTITIFGYDIAYASNKDKIAAKEEAYFKEKEANYNAEKSLIQAQIVYDNSLTKSKIDSVNQQKQSLDELKKAQEQYYGELTEQQQSFEDEQNAMMGEVATLFASPTAQGSINWYEETISKLEQARDKVDINSDAYRTLTRRIQEYQNALNSALASDALPEVVPPEISFKTREDELAQMFEKAQSYSQEIQKVISQTMDVVSNATQLRAQNEIAALDKKRQRGLITEKQYEKQVSKIKNEEAKKNKIARTIEAFAMIPMAILNALTSIPFPANIAAAAVVGALATAQAAIVAASPLPKFREGGSVAKRLGLIRGKSHEQGGVPIEVEGDEFVMSKKAVKHYGVDFMDRVNKMKLSPVVTMQAKMDHIKNTDYKLYEHLATLGGYMKQDYRANENGNNILLGIKEALKRNNTYV